MALFDAWATRKVASRDTPSTPIADEPDYPAMEMNAYAVPSLESGSPYNDEQGWSIPDLRPSSVEYPSAQRLMVIPRHDYRPDPIRPPDELGGFWERMDRDEEQRHTVETVDADGWAETKGILSSDRRWAPNPRSTPPGEVRLTEQMSASSYRFERPFDQHSARTFNGNHFSMADHRRSYMVNEFGMKPVSSARNTYRLEPTPWDINVVDMPPASPNIPYARTTGQDIPPSRSYRLM